MYVVLLDIYIYQLLPNFKNVPKKILDILQNLTENMRSR